MSVTSSGGSPNSINMRVCLARVIHSQSDEILIRWIAFLLFWHSNSWREIQTILIQLAKYQVVLKSDETLKHASEVPSFTFNSRPDARWQELEGWCANPDCIHWISVIRRNISACGQLSGFQVVRCFFLSAGLGCYSAVLFVEIIKVCLWSVSEK